MAVNGAPTLAELKAWLGLEPADTQDDVVLQDSLNAALSSQQQVCLLPRDAFGDSYYTDDLREAVWLRAQRLAARRNSPEGVVGLSGMSGDFVAARVPSFDNDVLHLEGSYRKIATA